MGVLPKSHKPTFQIPPTLN
jgi:hypothetical protein